jgi:hypothetical protein
MELPVSPLEGIDTLAARLRDDAVANDRVPFLPRSGRRVGASFVEEKLELDKSGPTPGAPYKHLLPIGFMRSNNRWSGP